MGCSYPDGRIKYAPRVPAGRLGILGAYFGTKVRALLVRDRTLKYIIKRGKMMQKNVFSRFGKRRIITETGSAYMDYLLSQTRKVMSFPT